jgi:hypothetical protein
MAAVMMALVGVIVMNSGALASGHLLALIMTILISAMIVIVRRNRSSVAMAAQTSIDLVNDEQSCESCFRTPTCG